MTRDHPPIKGPFLSEKIWRCWILLSRTNQNWESAKTLSTCCNVIGLEVTHYRYTLDSHAFEKLKSHLLAQHQEPTTRHFSTPQGLSLAETMKNPNLMYGNRNHGSGARRTPDRLTYSPSTVDYDASSIQKSRSGRNPMMMAVKSVAGVFVSCFTPPETTSSKNFGDSDEFRAPSGKYLIFW